MNICVCERETMRRIRCILSALLAGHNVRIEDLTLREVRFLKAEFGDCLKKYQNYIYLEV